jgi:hypothetical protein
MATTGEKRWPPVGNFVAAAGENSMAIDSHHGKVLETRCSPVRAKWMRQQGINQGKSNYSG